MRGRSVCVKLEEDRTLFVFITFTLHSHASYFCHLGSCVSPTEVSLMTTQRDVPIMTTAPTQNAVPVSTSKTEVPKKVVKRVLMTRTQYAAMKEGRQVVSLVGAGGNSQPTGGRVVLQQGQPIQTTTNAQNRVHLQGSNAVRRLPNNRTVIAVNTGNQPGCKPASTRTVIHAEGDVLGGCVEQTAVGDLCLVCDSESVALCDLFHSSTLSRFYVGVDIAHFYKKFQETTCLLFKTIGVKSGTISSSVILLEQFLMFALRLSLDNVHV